MVTYTPPSPAGVPDAADSSPNLVSSISNISYGVNVDESTSTGVPKDIVVLDRSPTTAEKRLEARLN